MRIDILTLFPEAFHGVLNTSILRRAQESSLLEIRLVNFRDYTHDRHRTVDDTPYGGGQGMLLKPEPVFEAMDHIASLPAQAAARKPHVVLCCPQGSLFTQHKAAELASYGHLILICGHYEGFDERIREGLADEAISIGDYILTGGELPAMVITDAVARLIPGVLAENSAHDDSFSQGLLEYPQYTRPPEYRGMKVPEILLSGDHGKIARWRKDQSLLRTWQQRPDLLEKADLDPEERKRLRKIAEKAACNEKDTL